MIDKGNVGCSVVDRLFVDLIKDDLMIAEFCLINLPCRNYHSPLT
jgi:hypothetical protein